jgi:predicted DNA-binding protein with PD1-like motif
MTHRFDGYNYVLRLDKGELLVQTLQEFIQKNHIKGAWISGLGGAQWVELGFYDLAAKQYHWRRFEQLLEVTALQGNISWQAEQPALHLHGTFADQDYRAIGGHIKELCVGGTIELFIHTIFGDKPLARKDDAKTGLRLLEL